jgi:oxygen-independent coproporphyrinogen-3 oxidase
MGLRLKEGVDLRRVERLSGRPADALVNKRAVAKLESQGLIHFEGDRLSVTSAGMLLLDAILTEVVA